MAFHEYFLMGDVRRMQISVCIDPKNAYVLLWAALIPLKVPNAGNDLQIIQ
jgi:hypothetical protein